MTLRPLFHNISKRKTRVKKEIVSVSYSKNHSNFDYCCSFYVRKKGVNFLFDAICKCGYIAFENVLIDETDMKQAGEKVNLATEHPEKVFELQQILRKVRNKSIQMK